MSATNGNPDLAQLLERGAWARRLARQLVRPDEADDLVQEAWLVAAAKAPPPGDVEPRTWLTGVLRVLGMQHARAAGRRRQRESEAAAAALDSSPAPDDVLAQVETQRRLVETLLALEEPYRTTVLLRYYEGLSAAEIARRTQVPVGTVRWRLKEGLDRLRRALDESAGGRRAWAVALVRFVSGGRVAKGVGRIAVGIGLTSGVVGIVALLAHPTRPSLPREKLTAIEDQAPQTGEKDGKNMNKSIGVLAVAAGLATHADPSAATAREIPPSKVPRFWVPLGVGPVKGPPTAKVTILAFMDYQSQFCLAGSRILDDLVAAHAHEVRYQVVHRPLPIHGRAAFAARAALAASQQGKFWEMHRTLLANQEALDVTDIDGYAQKIGLDLSRFKADIDSATVINQLDLDEANTQSLQINAIPAFFFNGRPIFGARPRAEFDRTLAEEIAYADAVLKAGVPPADLYNAITRQGATEVSSTPRPVLAPGDAPTSGSSVFDTAWKMINGNTAAVNACYAAEPTTKRAGWVVLHVVIAPGRAPAVSIRQSTMNSPKLEECIVHSMKGLVFPRAEGNKSVALSRRFAFPPEN